jgi:hypothetical protein
MAGTMNFLPAPSALATLWSATHDASQSGGPSSQEAGGNTTLPEWYSPSTGATGNYGGGEYTSEGGASVASQDHARSGTWAAKLSVDADGDGGARLFRWKELRTNRFAICEAWFYFPVDYELTHDPFTGQYLDLFQFKARNNSNVVMPIYLLTPEDVAGGHRFRVDWSSLSGIEGPHAGENGFRVYRPATDIMLPIGQWFGLRGYIKQSKDFDGAVTFWYLPPGGGAPQVIVRLSAVRTGEPNTVLSIPWSCANEWSVNNYTDGITPAPYSLYVDDARISSVVFGVVSAPDKPRSAVAAALNGGVRVSAIVAPDYDGGSSVDGYRVTAGAMTFTGAGPTIDVTGLTNGVAVAVTVQAHNAQGYGAALALGNVTPAVPPFEVIAQTGSSTSAPGSATTTHTVSRPGTAADGDSAEVALVIGGGSGGSPVNTTVGTPSGWTLVAGPVAAGGVGELKLYRFRRPLDGTAADTFTATSGLSCRGVLVMATMSHPDATPEDTTPATANASSGTTLNVGPITTGTDTAVAIGAWACLTGSGTMTAPTGMTQLATAVVTGGYRLSLFGSSAISPAGSYGPKSPTYNATRVSAGILDALAPDPL